MGSEPIIINMNQVTKAMPPGRLFTSKSKNQFILCSRGQKREELLQAFGKHTSGKACVYINKVADININVLKELIIQSVKFLRDTYPDNEI